MITDLLATLTSPNVASTATYYSTDHIDLMPLSATAGNSGRITNSQIDLGEGEQLYATFTVTTAFAGSTSYTFQIITGTTGVNGGTTAPSNAVVHATTGAILVANVGVGKQFVVPKDDSTGLLSDSRHIRPRTQPAELEQRQQGD
jgi:hypothetical protein